MAAATEQVMNWLDWCEWEYGQFKYDMAEAFLREYIGKDEHAIGQYMASKAFWGWWKLHWYAREQDFLSACDRAHLYYPDSALRRLKPRQVFYKILHKADYLGHNDNDYGAQLDESFSADLLPRMK